MISETVEYAALSLEASSLHKKSYLIIATCMQRKNSDEIC